MGRRTKIIRVTRESKALKRMREMKGLSVRKLAELLNVSHTLVSHLERGRANISEAYIEKFLTALCCSWEEWRIALSGEKKTQTLAKDKLNQDCLKKIQGLSEDKLMLLDSILKEIE